MLTIDAMGHGRGDYYTHLAAEDYYLKGGEPPGRWYGQGAADLELDGPVGEEVFGRLLEGFSPDGREKLVRNAGQENRQPGWDLTFSAPKSVSVLWSQGDEATRKEIEAAQKAAVEAALAYLEEEASWTRRGHNGTERERARLVVATFEHGPRTRNCTPMPCAPTSARGKTAKRRPL